MEAPRQTTGRSARERPTKRCFPRPSYRRAAAAGVVRTRKKEPLCKGIRVGDEHRSFRAECETEGCRVRLKEKDVLPALIRRNNSNGRMERKRYDESGRTSNV